MGESYLVQMFLSFSAHVIKAKYFWNCLYLHYTDTVIITITWQCGSRYVKTGLGLYYPSSSPICSSKPLRYWRRKWNNCIYCLVSILSTWPGFFQTLVWGLLGLSVGGSFMFLSGLGMTAALSTELSWWPLQNPPQGSAPGTDMGGGGAEGPFISTVRLPASCGCFTVNATGWWNSSPTTSLGSPRYYREQPPTLLFLCSRAILPGECIPFFLVLWGSSFPKIKRITRVGWQQVHREKAGWKFMTILTKFSTAGSHSEAKEVTLSTPRKTAKQLNSWELPLQAWWIYAET